MTSNRNTMMEAPPQKAQPPLPVQPTADDKTIALIKQCRDAFAEELAAYDIEPPIQHLHQGHADCVAWLAAHNIGAKP